MKKIFLITLLINIVYCLRGQPGINTSAYLKDSIIQK